MTDTPLVEGELNRKRAVLAVLPFLFLGLADVALILGWGLKPIWGFLILPPILFVCVLAYISFRTGFVQERPDEVPIDTDRQ